MTKRHAKPLPIDDFHVVPRDEATEHEYTGPDCRCEPMCRVVGTGIRVFVHQTHLIEVFHVKMNPAPRKPFGLLGPGDPGTN